MIANEDPVNSRSESDAQPPEIEESPQSSAHSQGNRSGDSVRFREAEIGDRGLVLGALSHDGSGLMRLAIQIQIDEIAFLSGDWRAIQQIVHDLARQKIEVIESQGSPWGFHNVLSVDEDGGPE